MDVSQWKHTVAATLLAQGGASLAAWYADPLPRAAAQDLEARAGQSLQLRLRTGAPCFQLQLLQLLCRFWLAGVATLEYAQLRVAADGAHERALLELVYGQLLVCRKYRQAHRHLQRGFTLASAELDAADYFRLLRRHELLAYLCLAESPAPPRDLDALLAEAAVIRCLRGGAVRQYRCAHLDTVG